MAYKSTCLGIHLYTQVHDTHSANIKIKNDIFSNVVMSEFHRIDSKSCCERCSNYVSPIFTITL